MKEREMASSLAREVANWLSNDEAQLKFVYGHEVQDEDLEEVLAASVQVLRSFLVKITLCNVFQECVCDPYINLANFASEIATLEDADGQKVTLERALRGKPCYLVVRSASICSNWQEVSLLSSPTPLKTISTSQDQNNW